MWGRGTIGRRDGRLPARVGDAAAARDLGGLLTGARGTGMSVSTRAVGAAVLFVLLPFAAAHLVDDLDLSSGVAAVLVLGPPLVGVVAGVVGLVLAPVLYLFERGAVVRRPGRSRVEVIDAADLVPYEWEEPRLRRGGAYPLLVVRGPAGPVFTCAHGEAVRLADVLATAALPRARARLDADRAVEFGLVTLTPDALLFGELALSWAGITGFRPTWGEIHVVGPGRRRFAPALLAALPRQETPHQRTLIALGQELAARARLSG